MIINYNDITIHSISSGANEVLFFYNNKLLRAPFPDKLNMYYDLIDLKTPIQTIIKTDLQLNHPQHGILNVFEHNIYEHMVKITESSITIQVEFIKTICNINKQLISKGYILQDIHEGNIYNTTDGIIWVDWGAINNINDNTAMSSLALTMYLVNKYIYKNYKKDHTTYDINIAKNTASPISYIASLDPWKIETWDEIIKTLDSLNITLLKSHWADEYALNINYKNLTNTNIKSKSFKQLLENIQYTTLTDVGCNKGYYTYYAAELQKIKSAIGIDLDDKCIEYAIKNKPLNLPILFACKNITDFNTYEQNIRYRSDLIVALAIVHHVDKSISHYEFAQILVNLCKKYIIIEDINTKEIYEDVFKQNNFILINRLASNPESRTLSLFSREV
ncbi:MAG: class I SAM-dependent methyltransferase [Clostridia bacterium]|jgi:2-polyprenyl-3-methyl-5-hydroxy-6-metoxy-1,4-benzoquinol methylase